MSSTQTPFPTNGAISQYHLYLVHSEVPRLVGQCRRKTPTILLSQLLDWHTLLFLLGSSPFLMTTKHNLYDDPSRFQANVARHIAHKVLHWAIRLAEFDFTVERILAENNVLADILTR